MSSPTSNASPKEMAELYKLNKKLYGTKPEIGPQKPQSFASYRLGENKAARAAGQDRPDRANLLQKYKDMKAAPVASTIQDNGPDVNSPYFAGFSAINPNSVRDGDAIPTDGGTTTSYQSGPSGGGGGGYGGGGTGKPNDSSLPVGAAYKKGGMTSKSSSAPRRGDGIAQRGKTRGKYI